MGILIGVLISVIVAALFVVILMLFKSSGPKKHKEGKLSESLQKRGSSAVVKELEKKLMHDPHNVEALSDLGKVFFDSKNWEKVWAVYKNLYSLAPVHSDIKISFCTRRMGIAAYELGKYDEAINALLLSGKEDPESFDTNYYLGLSFYCKEVYDKAVVCFRKCKILNPENPDCFLYLGMSFFMARKYKECLPYLKHVLDLQPDNKELLFNIAVAMSEVGLNDKALKIFVHLRPDPQYGAMSCLEAGKMHERLKDYDSAIKDYEIALKLQGVPDQILVQIKYHIANDYIATNNIPKGLSVLKQLQSTHPGYKDVDTLVLRYQELNQNQNLQMYLFSGTSDFVALCRKFITAYYPDGFVKVEDVNVISECVEIICYVESSKWEAKQMFRFYRTQNVIGDINVRDFHSKLRDTKCDNGVCISIGGFSDSAHKYIDGRPVDLIEKDELVKILKRINMFS
jgi:tetratricopeptide (TPR) repeat protein